MHTFGQTPQIGGTPLRSQHSRPTRVIGSSYQQLALSELLVEVWAAELPEANMAGASIDGIQPACAKRCPA